MKPAEIETGNTTLTIVIILGVIGAAILFMVLREAYLTRRFKNKIYKKHIKPHER